MRRRFLALLLLFSLALSACGGTGNAPDPNPPGPEEPADPGNPGEPGDPADPGDPGEPGDPADPGDPDDPPTTPTETAAVGRSGIVYLWEGILGRDVVTAAGQFVSYSELVDLPTQVNLGQDACSVTVGESKPEFPPFSNAFAPQPKPGLQVTNIDAGDVLTVSSQGSVYVTLENQGNLYGKPFSGDPLPFPPRNLTVDIPGSANGYPAFAGAAFAPAPEQFALSVSGGDFKNVTADTVFSWTGAGSDQGYFWFSGAGRNANGASVNFGCFARDDGSFTFPAQARQDLAAAGFTNGVMYNAVREARARIIRDKTALDLSVAYFEVYSQ